jgi:BirA family biotin operon repressor/biotin-[acetyl-CoA-carboxylase] ligase
LNSNAPRHQELTMVQEPVVSMLVKKELGWAALRATRLMHFTKSLYFYIVILLYSSVNLIEFDEIDSTNKRARQMLSEGKTALPFAILATSQTAGVGRFGRPFHSPVGGMYLTIVISERDFQYAFGTGFVAIVLRQLIAGKTWKSPSIKWVNDIYIDNKKVAGILVEKVLNNFVIGVGVNLKKNSTTQTPSELSDVIGYLDIDITAKDFAEQFINRLLSSNFSDQQIINEYTRHCLTMGTRRDGGVVSGINLDGSLNIKMPNGEINTVFN